MMQFFRTTGEGGRRKSDKAEQPERNRRVAYHNATPIEDTSRHRLYQARNNAEAERPTTIVIEARPARRNYQNGNDMKVDWPERNRNVAYHNTTSTEDTSRRRSYQYGKDAEAEHPTTIVIEAQRAPKHYQDGNDMKVDWPERNRHVAYRNTTSTDDISRRRSYQYRKNDGVDQLEHPNTIVIEARPAHRRYQNGNDMKVDWPERNPRTDHSDSSWTKYQAGRALYHRNTKGTERLLDKSMAARSAKARAEKIEARLRATEKAREEVEKKETFASKEVSSEKVLAKEPASLIDTVAWEMVFSEEIPPKEPTIPTEAVASKQFFSDVVPAKEPVVSAHAIESMEFSRNGLLEQAPTTPTDAVAINEVFQAENHAQAQVVSTISLEDTVQSRLRDFFLDDNQKRTAYSDSEIQRISTLLRQFNLPWSKVPRTYIVLRTIGCLDLLNTFVDLGYSDHWFPITERSLPPSLRPSKRSQFVAAQNLIMTKSMDFEKGQHCSFRKHERLPLEMKEILGTGAYGQVNRVLSSISFQEYALKRVPRTTVFGGRGTEFVKQFIAEIKVLKRIKHDHVVEFVGSYTDPKHMGLLMLPVADMDLSTYLERANVAKHRELRTFFGCLARALEFLHEQKIRHKDIKPSNILVHGGKVLYTDFGLALDFTDKDGSTTGSMVNGRTAKYCAPEVADCESRNTSSDIWSLGVVFLEMTAVLKGKTVGDVYEFLKRLGTGQAFVRTNPTGTAALIAELKVTGNHIDNVALGWVRDMIMLQQQLRPTANLLIGDIITAGQEEGANGAFCGICCASHDDLSSDLDSEC